MTPMMQQYLEVKKEYPDTLLFYRLGDFYEMFFEDAKIASRELELVLTGRDCGEEERAPMCGVPYHAAESYISKLMSRGYKVAICEQAEVTPGYKGLLEREVKRVITPGTIIEGDMLEEGSNNYLVSIYAVGDDVGLCFIDISTGEVNVTQIKDKKDGSAVFSELTRYNPKEMIINRSALENEKLKTRIRMNYSGLVEPMDDRLFDREICGEAVCGHFGRSLDELGLSGSELAVSALGVSFYYLHSTQKNDLDNIRDVNFYTQSQYMRLDVSSLRNLELTQTLRNGQKKGTLMWVLDYTKTAMGKRMLKSWMEHPLMNVADITRRQNAVAELCSVFAVRCELMDLLCEINDIERIATRITYGTANPKELVTLARAVESLPRVKEILSEMSSQLLVATNGGIDTLSDIRDMIVNTVVDDPPILVREGGIIKRGYSRELDELFGIIDGGKGFLSEIEQREQEKTGIKKLKIGYNRVFGYYIEVSNSFRDKVPDTYIRKQTLVNCERFITQELKELEGKVLGAREKAMQFEYEIFTKLRKDIAKQIIRIQMTARSVAVLDVLLSLATAACEHNYVCPEMTLDDVIDIRDGRHPVVERLMTESPFVPNSTLLDSDENRTAIITGPNMAGKSTYMRQVALIVLMAQMGSFVPASSARLGIVDGIFTRVGASDDLSSGQSTFMVEMNEVAFILNNATSKSLLILDEIGRGTSTFDGMSIARAVLEYVTDKKKIGAKTLFSTHYHELTDLENAIEGVKNYNIAVKRRGDDITFLRRIVRGGADDSYGVLVAKLAGVPNAVIKNAKSILAELERGEEGGSRHIVVDADTLTDEAHAQIVDMASINLIDKLKSIDTDTLTPIEAMNTLFNLVNEAKGI